MSIHPRLFVPQPRYMSVAQQLGRCCTTALTCIWQNVLPNWARHERDQANTRSAPIWRVTQTLSPMPRSLLSMRRRVVSVIRVMIISIMMQRDTVELLERINDFPTRRCQATIQRYALHGPGVANVHALALLHVAEVDGINAAALVGDDRRLHVANQCPLSRAEEGVHFDVRSACAGA